MKRLCKFTLAAAWMLVILSVCPLWATAQSAETDYAAQQWDASGFEDLYELLPEETARLLERMGIDAFSWDALMAMDTQTVWSALRDMVDGQSRTPFKTAGWMLGGVVLVAVVRTLLADGTVTVTTVRTVGMLAVLSPLLVPLWQLMERTQAAADSAGVFSLSFAPIYAAVLTAQGHTASAVSYQTWMLSSAQAGSLLIGSVILPLLYISLALGMAGAVNTEHSLKEVARGMNKTALFLIGFSMTVFVAVLSFQGVVSATADSVGGRIMRFSVAGFVPVVGGALSEALYTVRGCLSTVRGTMGGFGVIATVAILLPTWLEAVLWSGALWLVRTAASMLTFPEADAVLGTVQGVVKTLIGVLSACALFMIVSLTVMTVTGGNRL